MPFRWATDVDIAAPPSDVARVRCRALSGASDGVTRGRTPDLEVGAPILRAPYAPIGTPGPGRRPDLACPTVDLEGLERDHIGEDSGGARRRRSRDRLAKVTKFGLGKVAASIDVSSDLASAKDHLEGAVLSDVNTVTGRTAIHETGRG